jgi:integration host factor subunit beta
MATTKKNLIDRIAESTGTPQTLVKTVVQQLFDEVITQLGQGNRLELRDFGILETRISPPRTAQNPRTLAKVNVPAKRRIVFKPGRFLKQQLNRSTSA